VNEALDGLLMVGLSTCDGASGHKMAMWETGAPPFGLLFAHAGPGSWPDLAIGFAAFYHRFIHKDSGFSKSVEAMKAASGSDQFKIAFGPMVQAEWTEYFKQATSRRITEDASRFVTERAAQAGPTPPS
jgi:hypothetical protein